MNPDLLSTILMSTYSLTQLRHRVRILKLNLIKTFFGSSAENLALSPSDLNWLKSLPADFYQRFTKDSVYQIFADLEEKSKHLPILTMYLAFEPDEATLNQIGLFVRKAFGLVLLLDVRLDPSLIAGTALAWKGVYRDYSLRTKIDSKKSEILQGLHKFLR